MDTVRDGIVDRCAALLAPRSIAVVGASARPGPGQRVVSNLLAAGFTGALYLINPKHAAVADLRAYPSLGDLPEVPELVIVAVNREAAVSVLSDAARRGCLAGLLLGAGFGEADRRGLELEEQLRIVTPMMVLMGPNCLGYVNLEERIAAYSGPLMEPLQCGNVALVSNSGAMACTLTGAAAERGIRFSHVITTGNQIDLTVVDYVHYLSRRAVVRVMACFVEGFSDGRALLDAFDEARAAGQVVIVLKAGRSAAGGEAARTHTGALAGSDAIQRSLWRQHSVLVADDLEGFLALIALCSMCPAPAGPRLGAVTISGGERLLLTDTAETVGLPLAALREETRRGLAALLPPYASVSNPLDTTGAGLVERDGSVHGAGARLLAHDPSVDIVLVCQDAKNGWVQAQQEATLFYDGVVATWEAAFDAGKPVVVLSPTTGQVDERARRYMQEHGIPLLLGLGPGMTALAQFVRMHCGASGETHTSPIRPVEGQKGTALSGFDALRRLERAGIPVWPTEVATSENLAVTAAETLGYPVALKLDGPGLLHRTEPGGVRLNLGDGTAVRRAWRELIERARSNGIPALTIVVQPMVSGGVELFVGGLHDDQFGPVVLCGAGGILLEFVGDIAAGMAPLDLACAKQLLQTTRVSRLLNGWRGSPPVDMPSLGRALVAISQVVAEPDVLALDVNPLIALPEGIALVDAKLVVKDAIEPAS